MKRTIINIKIATIIHKTKPLLPPVLGGSFGADTALFGVSGFVMVFIPSPSSSISLNCLHDAAKLILGGTKKVPFGLTDAVIMQEDVDLQLPAVVFAPCGRIVSFWGAEHLGK